MAYEKQTWTTGETITANKLNHMEDGIEDSGNSDAPFYIDFVYNDGFTTSITFNDVVEACVSGRRIVPRINTSNGDITSYIEGNLKKISYGSSSMGNNVYECLFVTFDSSVNTGQLYSVMTLVVPQNDRIVSYMGQITIPNQ